MERRDLTVIARLSQLLCPCDRFLGFDGELVEAHSFSVSLARRKEQAKSPAAKDALAVVYKPPKGLKTANRRAGLCRLQNWQNCLSANNAKDAKDAKKTNFKTHLLFFLCAL